MIALFILPGSAFLLLTTNVGARLGFLLAAAGFFGWMTVLGTIWWVYGRGPLGPAGGWKPVEVVVGEAGSHAHTDALAGFPKGWEKLKESDPKVADAVPVADGKLTEGTFKNASDFVVTGAATKGGERHGPLGLDFRPFNVLHTPHYLVIQVQKAVKPPAAPGQPPPKPTADPTAPPVAVVLLRDLGAVRLHPAVVALSCATIFGLVVFTLHNRDKEAAAEREEAGQT
jgi:hypothetical protein